jgi:hypothetical protein
VGFAVIRAGRITGASLRVNTIDADDFELEIRVNGLTVATLALPAGTTVATTSALNAPVAVGDIVTAFLFRTAGSGASTFSDEQATIEIAIP